MRVHICSLQVVTPGLEIHAESSTRQSSARTLSNDFAHVKMKQGAKAAPAEAPNGAENRGGRSHSGRCRPSFWAGAPVLCPSAALSVTCIVHRCCFHHATQHSMRVRFYLVRHNHAAGHCHGGHVGRSLNAHAALLAVDCVLVQRERLMFPLLVTAVK